MPLVGLPDWQVRQLLLLGPLQVTHMLLQARHWPEVESKKNELNPLVPGQAQVLVPVRAAGVLQPVQSLALGPLHL